MLFPIVLPSPLLSPTHVSMAAPYKLMLTRTAPDFLLIVSFDLHSACLVVQALMTVFCVFFTAHYFTLNPCLLFGMILYFYIHVYSTYRVCYLLFANGSVEKMWLSIELNRIELPILYCLSVRISYVVWTLWPFGFLARGQDVGSTRIVKYMAANELRRCSREDVFSLYLPLDPWLSTAGADWSFLCGWNSIWFGSSGTA